MILEKIQKPNDIKKLSEAELELLSVEIRQFLLDSISRSGGHLASNLGVVELTMALHLCLNMPEDKIVWDVGHQSYTHKILTGRREGFSSLRQYHGMSGFPKASESPCDCFNTGHSSTSVSAGLGMAKARELQGKQNYVVSVIGDGSLTGGMAYEALNNASIMKSNFIVVLNDNNMSISKNVGGMSTYLAKFRTGANYQNLKDGVKKSLANIPIYGEKMVKQIHTTKQHFKQWFIPGMFFEELGIMYIGPVDGHNLKALREAIEEAKKVQGPVLLHVLTEKGKGYPLAEHNPSKFHGAEPFDLKTGLPLKKKTAPSWTDIFGQAMLKQGEKTSNMVAITAAMSDGTGLTPFAKKYPDRFFDVGIAEAHAVTFSAGLSKAGLIPVFAVYSSFLQRGFDQILHDVCIQDLHVVFAIDRAGLVGADGETHQGIFDLSYLASTPNMTELAPKNAWELGEMLDYAVNHYHGPIAIRYSRGSAFDGMSDHRQPIEYGRAEMLHRGTSKIAIMALGTMVETAAAVAERMKAEKGLDVTVINARFAVPFDDELVEELSLDHDLLITIEENVLNGSMGQRIGAHVQGERIPIHVMPIALPNGYVEHGNVEQLRRDMRIDADSIMERIEERISSMNR